MKSRLKLLLVFGTRPEAIKMAPLIKALQSKQNFEVKVCVTAQHREMLDQVLDIFEIIPNYDLNLMKPKQDLYDITTNVMLGMKEVFAEYTPNLVLVHGDTTTTFATSLAAFYKKIKVGHIEAGLRTNNIYSPWPEEGNRGLTGVLANYHFAPTTISKENLLKEAKNESDVIVTGNTVIDALFLTLHKIESTPKLNARIKNELKEINFDIENSKFILVTAHRRENLGEGLQNICKALKEIASKNLNINIVYPVHLNPKVQKPVNELLGNIENICLISPLKYETFVYLMSKSYFVITDSGGIQEEAPSLGKPVLVMRDTTERPEAVSSGTVKLVGTNSATIVTEAQLLIENKEAYNKMSRSYNPYGDGKASDRITTYIEKQFLDGNI